jgi:hypothetical protein
MVVFAGLTTSGMVTTTATASTRGRSKPVLSDCWAGFPHTLDYGVYWFGPGNRFEKHSETSSRYFDNARLNTVVYTHGWEANRISEGYRETFNYMLNDPRNGVDVDTVDEWVRKGWNVGVFYWDQFSDELLVLDAEAKIHSADGGGKGMRWRTQSGFSTVGAPVGKSVIDLFTDAIAESLRGYTGGLRLAGHSLGSQVCFRLLSTLWVLLRFSTLKAPAWILFSVWLSLWYKIGPLTTAFP